MYKGCWYWFGNLLFFLVRGTWNADHIAIRSNSLGTNYFFGLTQLVGDLQVISWRFSDPGISGTGFGMREGECLNLFQNYSDFCGLGILVFGGCLRDPFINSFSGRGNGTF